MITWPISLLTLKTALHSLFLAASRWGQIQTGPGSISTLLDAYLLVYPPNIYILHLNSSGVSLSLNKRWRWLYAYQRNCQVQGSPSYNAISPLMERNISEICLRATWLTNIFLSTFGPPFYFFLTWANTGYSDLSFLAFYRHFTLLSSSWTW